MSLPRGGKVASHPLPILLEHRTQVAVVPSPQNARHATEVDTREGSVEIPFVFEGKDSVLLLF